MKMGKLAFKLPKDYMGDSVYAEWNGYALVLTTEDGVSFCSTIELEPSVLEAINRYMDRAASDER